MAVLLTAFTPCFQARSVAVFQWLIIGWVQCQGRRTLTGVALASGAIGARHISVFHRFFSRASWTLDALGHVAFTLAVKWLPADQPLVVLGDDTLARKSGKSIALASMHHDPLLSSARKPFASFGHVWVVLALWLPLLPRAVRIVDGLTIGLGGLWLAWAIWRKGARTSIRTAPFGRR